MTLTPHNIIHSDACFAYFNKIWGTPLEDFRGLVDSISGWDGPSSESRECCEFLPMTVEVGLALFERRCALSLKHRPIQFRFCEHLFLLRLLLRKNPMRQRPDRSIQTKSRGVA